MSRLISALLASGLLLLAGCQTAFSFRAPASDDFSIPIVTEGQATAEYEVVGVVSSRGYSSSIDVLGLISPAHEQAGLAMSFAIKEGLIREALALRADAITNVQMSSYSAFNGCAVLLVPLSEASVVVTATALRRKANISSPPPVAPGR